MWQTDEAFSRFLRGAEITTLVALGMALGAAIDSELSMENWLYRWSTLLAGILAVSAAFITVRAMMHTDVRQQFRHEQLMKLNLRSERLIAVRAAELWANPLRHRAQEFEVFRSKLPEDNQKIEAAKATDLAIEIKDCAKNVLVVITHRSIVSTADIADSETYRFVAMEEGVLGHIIQGCDYLRGLVGSNENSLLPARKQSYSEFRQYLADSALNLRTIADGLEKLADEYR